MKIRLLSRSFHCSATFLQRPDHRLYPKLDWDRIEGGEYAIVDPLDPQAILYLPERDYIIQTRVSQTQGNKPVILATPQDKRPSADDADSPNSKKSPPWGSNRDLKWRISSMFNNIFGFVKKVRVESKHGLVFENQVVVESETLVPLFRVWAYTLHRRIVGLKSDRAQNDSVIMFARKLKFLLKHHGINDLIQRLRVYLFVINAYLSGNALETTHSLGKRYRLTNGLPRLLPLGVRKSIRKRNKSTIIIWASLLYVYRAMAGKHSIPDLSSVSQVYTYDDNHRAVEASFVGFIPRFTTWLLETANVRRKSILSSLAAKDLVISSAAGPNGSWSLISAPLDTLAWVFEGGLDFGSALRDWFRLTNSMHLNQLFGIYTKKLVTKLYGEEDAKKILRGDPEQLSVARSRFMDSSCSVPLIRGWFQGKHVRKPCLGRLHALREAAGKVRIIAVGDIWSQSALRPLHDFMFRLLKALPADATFDQQEGVNSFAKEGHKEIYSYDLSAATENIPYQLYVIVMAGILGQEVATAWMRLLRERSFENPYWPFTKTTRQGSKEVRRQIIHHGSTTIKYGRGQPMGFLSSWGALALLHHAIVQFSAYRVGRFPFADYRVLGDDIVIAGAPVAESYRSVCANLGVIIGLPKSFTSSDSFFNFASQTFIGPDNLSPFSFADELAVNSAQSRFTQVYRAIAKGYLDVNSDNFFARLVRWALPPAVAKRVELSRRHGIVHNAVHYIAGLIFAAYLSESKTFIGALQGSSIIEASSGLLRPGLQLFSASLAKVLQSSVTDFERTAVALNTYKELARKEHKALMSSLKARMLSLENLMSTPLVSWSLMIKRGIPPIKYPPHSYGADILDLIELEQTDRFESAADETDQLKVDSMKDNIFHPLEEINDICDLYEIPRWLLDYQKGCRVQWPESVNLGGRDYALDWATILLLDDPTFQGPFLKSLLKELTILSRRYQTLEHQAVPILKDDVDYIFVNEVNKLIDKHTEIPEAERITAVYNMRQIIVDQVEASLRNLTLFMGVTRNLIDNSMISKLVQSTPQAVARDFDKTLVNILSTGFWSLITSKEVRKDSLSEKKGIIKEPEGS